MTSKGSTLAVAGILISAFASWFIGWFIWDEFSLWHGMHNKQYENLLLAFILVYVSSSVLVWRWRFEKGSKVVGPEPIASSASSSIPIAPQAPIRVIDGPVKSNNPLPEELLASLREIKEKQADTHAMMKFLKTREERTPAKKHIVTLPEDVNQDIEQAEKAKEEAKKALTPVKPKAPEKAEKGA